MYKYVNVEIHCIMFSMSWYILIVVIVTDICCCYYGQHYKIINLLYIVKILLDRFDIFNTNRDYMM